MSEHVLHFVLNGAPQTVRVPAHRLLLELLRDDFNLTGTKEGCSVGVCGACSVLVNGDVMSACLLPAVFVRQIDVQHLALVTVQWVVDHRPWDLGIRVVCHHGVNAVPSWRGRVLST